MADKTSYLKSIVDPLERETPQLYLKSKWGESSLESRLKEPLEIFRDQAKRAVTVASGVDTAIVVKAYNIIDRIFKALVKLEHIETIERFLAEKDPIADEIQSDLDKFAEIWPAFGLEELRSAVQGQAISEGIEKLNGMIGEIEGKKGTINQILEKAQQIGAPLAYKEYAQIFFNESRRHSRRFFARYSGNIPTATIKNSTPVKNTDDKEKFSAKCRRWFAKFRAWFGIAREMTGGSAERLFLGGILIIISGYCLVRATVGTSLLDNKGNFEWASLPLLASKTLGILVLIFLLRLAVKQYTIHKNIAETNRHRANALNSFAFLFSSVGTEVPAVREQLTVLVATAVYQSIETGFLSDKTTEIGVLPLEVLGKMAGRG